MVEKLLSLFRKEKPPCLGWRGLNEAFITWQRATHARDIARISVDAEKYLRLDLLSAMAWRRYVRRREEIIPAGEHQTVGLDAIVFILKSARSPRAFLVKVREDD